MTRRIWFQTLCGGIGAWLFKGTHNRNLITKLPGRVGRVLNANEYIAARQLSKQAHIIDPKSWIYLPNRPSWVDWGTGKAFWARGKTR